MDNDNIADGGQQAFLTALMICIIFAFNNHPMFFCTAQEKAATNYTGEWRYLACD